MASQFDFDKNKNGQQERDLRVDPRAQQVLDFNELINDYENVLLKYNSISWCFTLSTISAVDLLKYQQGFSDSVQHFIISKTGVTGKYSIDEVVIKSLPPGQQNTKTNTLREMVITLSEQGDLTFYDELQRMTAILGYQQTMNVPLFLNLEFKGYSDSEPHVPIVIPEATRTWRLRINNIECRTDNQGATAIYDIKCTSGSHAHQDMEWRLHEQIEVVCGATVGSFMTAFEKSLNIVANGQYGYMTLLFPNEIQPDSFYTFHVHPDVANLIITNDKEQDTANDKTDTGEAGSKRYSFNPSQTIGNVIDSVMDSAYMPSNTSQFPNRQFVHVIPVAYYVGYDRWRRKIAYRYEIYILPLKTIDAQNVDEHRNKNKAIDLLEVLERNARVNNKLNIKRYDYQWSGLNNEILNLNFDFNAAYNVMSTRSISSLYDPYNRTGEKASTLSAEDQLTHEQATMMYQRKSELEQKERSTGLSAEEQIELRSVNASLDEMKTIVVEGEEAQAKMLSAFSSNDGKPVYAEDISAEAWQNTLNKVPLDYVKAPIDYANIKDDSSNTIDSNSNTGEVEKRMARSNYYNDAFLLKLDMQVVGDPHWLGHSDKDLMDNIRLIMNGQELPVNPIVPIANSLTTDQAFLLNLYPVTGFNTIGNPEHKYDRFMRQAIYRVTEITSTFNDRGFIQNIKGCVVARSINRW